MNSKRRVVMKDVAARAGVHQTTVSLALRGHPSISQSTRERIQKLAVEMGYQPDPALSALVAYRGNTRTQPKAESLAFILNFKENARFHESHVHGQLLRGAQRRAESLGYRLEAFWFGRDYPRSEALDRVLKTRQIRGLILGAFYHQNADLKLDWPCYSVAKINLFPVELPFEAVLSNQMFAVRLAMRRLHEAGHSRVGLVVAEHDEIHNRNLYTGGYQVGQRHFAPADRVPALVLPQKPYPEMEQMVHDWAIEHQLDAILSNWNSFDSVAREISLKRSLSCRFVPMDCNDLTRPLGGIDQNHDLVGEKAVDLLVGQMQTFRRGIPEHPSMTLVDPSWIEPAMKPQKARVKG